MENPGWPYKEIYRSDNKQEVLVKQSILESEGIESVIKNIPNPAMGSGWGMPVGMEDGMRLFTLLVHPHESAQAEEILALGQAETKRNEGTPPPISQELIFIVLLDRKHEVCYEKAGFPRDAIDEAADPRSFSYIGSIGGSRGMYQFFLSKKSSGRLKPLAGAYSWRPIRDVLEAEKDSPFRQAYCALLLKGYDPPAVLFSTIAFGTDSLDAGYYGKLALRGVKTVRTGLKWRYEEMGGTLPVPEEIRIILDGRGRPLAAVRVTSVEIHRFKDIPERVAVAEGEGDGGTQSWKKIRRRAFKAEARRLGRGRSPDMEIVCEFFEVIRKFENDGAGK